MSNSPPCQFLPWDTDFFGFRIARVTDGRLTCGGWDRIQAWCTEERIRCLYLLARGDDPETARIAADHEFRFVDIRTEYRCRPEIRQSAAPGLRPAAAEDIPALAEIARRSHTDSRFYYDHHFPRERCDAFYSAWIENSCQAYAKAVIVAEQDNKPAGYITCDWTQGTGRIGLFAVADWARGRGLGQALVGSALQLFYEHDVQTVKVVTQGRNIQSQRLYVRCGFVIDSVHIWYHRWFSNDS